MTKCAVVNCKSRSEQTYRLFSLPRGEPRRKEWIKFSQRDPLSFDPAKQYRFCERHFDENQYELNRQDNWKKLKPNAIPSINPPILKVPTSGAKRKREKKIVQKSNTIRNVELEHNLPKKNSIKTRKRRTATYCISTLNVQNVNSELPNETAENTDVEEIFIDLDSENEKPPTKEIAEDEPVLSEIHKLRSENEKLRKENEQLRTTIVKMQKILTRRRFTYLNVKALLQNKNKASIFKKEKS